MRQCWVVGVLIDSIGGSSYNEDRCLSQIEAREAAITRDHEAFFRPDLNDSMKQQCCEIVRVHVTRPLLGCGPLESSEYRDAVGKLSQFAQEACDLIREFNYEEWKCRTMITESWNGADQLVIYGAESRAQFIRDLGEFLRTTQETLNQVCVGNNRYERERSELVWYVKQIIDELQSRPINPHASFN